MNKELIEKIVKQKREKERQEKERLRESMKKDVAFAKDELSIKT